MKTVNNVVSDYSTGTVHLFKNQTILGPIDGQDESSIVEDFLVSQRFHLSNCSWMFSEDEIEIVNH